MPDPTDLAAKREALREKVALAVKPEAYEDVPDRTGGLGHRVFLPNVRILAIADAAIAAMPDIAALEDANAALLATCEQVAGKLEALASEMNGLDDTIEEDGEGAVFWQRFEVIEASTRTLAATLRADAPSEEA